jgi:hypothetical protein
VVARVARTGIHKIRKILNVEKGGKGDSRWLRRGDRETGGGVVRGLDQAHP